MATRSNILVMGWISNDESVPLLQKQHRPLGPRWWLERDAWEKSPGELPPVTTVPGSTVEQPRSRADSRFSS